MVVDSGVIVIVAMESTGNFDTGSGVVG